MTSVGSARPGTGPCAEASAKSESTTALEPGRARPRRWPGRRRRPSVSRPLGAGLQRPRRRRRATPRSPGSRRPFQTDSHPAEAGLDRARERAVRRRDKVQLAGQRLSGDRIERRAEAVRRRASSMPSQRWIRSSSSRPAERRRSWIARWSLPHVALVRATRRSATCRARRPGRHRPRPPCRVEARPGSRPHRGPVDARQPHAAAGQELYVVGSGGRHDRRDGGPQALADARQERLDPSLDELGVVVDDDHPTHVGLGRHQLDQGRRRSRSAPPGTASQSCASGCRERIPAPERRRPDQLHGPPSRGHRHL